MFSSPEGTQGLLQSHSKIQQYCLRQAVSRRGCTLPTTPLTRFRDAEEGHLQASHMN